MRNSIIFDDKEYPLDDDFWTEFNKYLKLKHLKAADVYKAVGFTNTSFGAAKRIKSDGTNNPSRNDAIRLAIALKLDIHDTKSLLANAGYAFSRSNKFDLILLTCKENGLHNVVRINEQLYDNGQTMFKISEE